MTTNVIHGYVKDVQLWQKKRKIKKEEKENKKVSLSDEQIFARYINNMLDVYKRKNHDYGNSFSEQYRKFGLLSSVIRLHDKLNRLQSFTKLTSDEMQVKDESVKDTLLDLANYAIMTIVQIDKVEKEVG